jgi:hypothetical protein
MYRCPKKAFSTKLHHNQSSGSQTVRWHSNETCVQIFFTTFLLKSFYRDIHGITQEFCSRYAEWNVNLHVKCQLLADFIQKRTCSQILVKLPNIKFHENTSELLHAVRRSGRWGDVNTLKWQRPEYFNIGTPDSIPWETKTGCPPCSVGLCLILFSGPLCTVNRVEVYQLFAFIFLTPNLTPNSQYSVWLRIWRPGFDPRQR